MNYVELHCHTEYSALDGLNSPLEYMQRAKEIGMTHLAQTDHGTNMGHRAHQIAGQKTGVTPILGQEMYISETDRFDKRAKAKRTDNTNVYNHIIVLAQNAQGLVNLNRLSQRAYEEGFYHKPRIDYELLEEHGEGIVLLSGCLSGLIAKAIDRGDEKAALDHAKKMMRIAPGRFYIEVQNHNPPELNQKLLEIADRFDIPPVATSDCHHARKEDLWVQEALLILSTKPNKIKPYDLDKASKMDFLDRFNYLYPDRQMTFQKFGLFLHTMQEHMEAFERQGVTRTDIYDNTVTIANSIEGYPFHQGLDLLPRPVNADPDVILEEKCREGMSKLGLAGLRQYEGRLAQEVKDIQNKGVSTYFLMTADAVNWAKSKGILVGPGRGSAAGSLVSYVLGITSIDPVKEGLIFARFLDVGFVDKFEPSFERISN